METLNPVIPFFFEDVFVPDVDNYRDLCAHYKNLSLVSKECHVLALRLFNTLKRLQAFRDRRCFPMQEYAQLLLTYNDPKKAQFFVSRSQIFKSDDSRLRADFITFAIEQGCEVVVKLAQADQEGPQFSERCEMYLRKNLKDQLTSYLASQPDLVQRRPPLTEKGVFDIAASLGQLPLLRECLNPEVRKIISERSRENSLDSWYFRERDFSDRVLQFIRVELAKEGQLLELQKELKELRPYIAAYGSFELCKYVFELSLQWENKKDASLQQKETFLENEFGIRSRDLLIQIACVHGNTNYVQALDFQLPHRWISMMSSAIRNGSIEIVKICYHRGAVLFNDSGYYSLFYNLVEEAIASLRGDDLRSFFEMEPGLFRFHLRVKPLILIDYVSSNKHKTCDFLLGVCSEFLNSPLDRDENTLLHVAAEVEACCACLLKKGAKQSANRQGQTPFDRAVELGTVENVTILLEDQIKTGGFSSDKATESAKRVMGFKSPREIAIYKLLMRNGAKQMPNDQEKTPLMYAAKRGDVALFNFLLDNDATTIDYEDVQERTALMHAIDNNRFNICQILLAKGANQVRAFDKKTALMCAAEEGHRDLVTLLLDNNDPMMIEAVDDSGNTALLNGISIGSLEVVAELLRRGAQQVCSSTGATPLMRAAERGHMDIVKFLLDQNDSELIDTQDQNGCTALMYSVLRQQSDVCKLLLERGAKQLCDFEGTTPLMAAKEKQRDDIVELLEKYLQESTARTKRAAGPVEAGLERDAKQVCSVKDTASPKASKAKTKRPASPVEGRLEKRITL